MSTRLYVGGLAWATTDQELQAAFAQAGNVVSTRVMVDSATGRSRGFGFVEMDTDEAGQKAIEMWNGKDLGGRQIVVNIARPLEDRPPRQGGYDRGPRDFNHRGGNSFGNRGGSGSGFSRGGFSHGSSGGGRSFGGGGGRGRGGSGFRSGSR